jgi:phenylpyruvate tautomerase PptA (4-oxalocrotonate tautomerase family)
MPAALIEVRRQYTDAEEMAIIDAVHAAMRDAFQLPAHDRTVRLVVHAPHRFACPPDRATPESYTHIGIDAFAGRSLETKRTLYRMLVDNLASLGIPKDHVLIMMREIPKENWGVRGGQSACDIDLGFTIEV